MKKKTLIIMAHSNPNDSKINKRIKHTLENEEDIIYKDIKSLYQDYNFDVKKEQEALMNAQKIIFQFPLYWWTAPAILKQWMDDIYTYGFAYKYDDKGAWKALKLQNKEFQMIVTIGGSEEDYKNMNVKVKDCLSSYSITASALGMKELDPYLLYGVDTHKYTNEQLDDIMLEVKEHIL